MSEQVAGAELVHHALDLPGPGHTLVAPGPKGENRSQGIDDAHGKEFDDA
jgi:hypothetical protein